MTPRVPFALHLFGCFSTFLANFSFGQATTLVAICPATILGFRLLAPNGYLYPSLLAFFGLLHVAGLWYNRLLLLGALICILIAGGIESSLGAPGQSAHLADQTMVHRDVEHRPRQFSAQAPLPRPCNSTTGHVVHVQRVQLVEAKHQKPAILIFRRPIRSTYLTSNEMAHRFRQFSSNMFS